MNLITLAYEADITEMYPPKKKPNFQLNGIGI